MEDQDQIILRIEQILDDYQLTQSEFAAKIGISKAKLSHYLTQHSKPSLELIKNTLEQFEDVNSDWLILGIGPMRSLDSNDDIIDSNSSDNINKDSFVDNENNLFSDSVINNEIDTQDSDKQSSSAHGENEEKSNLKDGIKNYTDISREGIKKYTENDSKKQEIEDNNNSLEIDISSNSSSQAKISDSRVKKIILLYDNDTYQEFSPNN